MGNRPKLDGALTVNAKWADGMVSNNSWRTVENLAIIPSFDVPWKNTKGIMCIAVSQAAPLRRLRVKGELQLLGSDEKLDWQQTDNALVVTLPAQKPCQFAHGLKITGDNLKAAPAVRGK